MSYNGVKVFSATPARDRAALAGRVNDWIYEEKVLVVDTAVLQSSDHAFHCLTIVIFYRRD